MCVYVVNKKLMCDKGYDKIWVISTVCEGISFLSVFLFLHLCTMHNSSTFSLLINTQKQYLSPFAPHSITLLWEAVLADLHWLLWAISYPLCSRAKKIKIKIQAFSFIKAAVVRHLPRRTTVISLSFFFTPIFSLFSFLTNNCHVLKNQEGAVICNCPLFQ